MAKTREEFKQEHSPIVEELERKLKESEKKYDDFRKDYGKLDLFFKRISDKIIPIKSLDNYYDPTVSPRKVDSPIAAVFRVSDEHNGMVQGAEEIEGFGKYNPEICDKRVLSNVIGFNNYIKLHRTAYQIPVCHMLVTGDLISGDIHNELRKTNAYPVPVQVVRAAENMGRRISLLAPNFEKIIVEFVTEDNHGRLQIKPEHKEGGKDTYNYIIGYYAKELVRDIPNVEFNIHPMLEKVVNVMERRYLITHGHNVRGWMGIPWYGIERQVGREAKKRMSVLMDNLRKEDVEKALDIGFDKYVFGHYHSWFEMRLYSCCASVSGTDAYDHSCGRYEPPGQTAWLVHPKHGEFNYINFKLT